MDFYRDPEVFIVANHKKYGKAFGFSLQNQTHFSIDMKTYMKELYSFPYESMNMDVFESIFPLNDSYIFVKIVRTAHPPNLMADIDNIRDQFQKFLDDEFKFQNNNDQEFTVDFMGFFYRACAVFNMWTFVGLDYSLMAPFIKELGLLYVASGVDTDKLYAYPMLARIFRRRMAKYGPIFEKLLMPIIKQRRQESHGSQRYDLLQVFLDYQDPDTGSTLSDHEVLCEIFSLLLAAGSVATSMADVVKRILAIDQVGPTYLRKAEHEQRKVIQEEGPAFTSAALGKMPYFDAIIRETLRLEFTLTSWRKACEDITFQDGLTIPKGHLILMTMVGVNLNDELFPEPKKWDPDRYFDKDENISQSAPSPFLWGAGLHPCAGKKHAHLGLKLLPLMMMRQSICAHRMTPKNCT